MYFREYSNSSDTLKEWAKQLNIVNKGTYPLYPTVESTLSHWRSILNRNIGTNTFDFNGNADSTIRNWKEKLNGIYNR
jgi:hypothetical protein